MINQSTLSNTRFNDVEQAAIAGFVDNILAYYDQADETLYTAGAGWYRYAQVFCERVARECGISPKAAGTIRDPR